MKALNCGSIGSNVTSPSETAFSPEIATETE
jgi:hypothetical protein